MGLLGFINESAKVNIAGTQLHITFLPNSRGKRREDELSVITVGDKVFKLFEPAAYPDVNDAFKSMIALAGKHGIPVLANLNGKAIVADRHDTPKGVSETYGSIPSDDLQAGIDAYEKRVSARTFAAGVRVGETGSTSHTAMIDAERTQPGGQGHKR